MAELDVAHDEFKRVLKKKQMEDLQSRLAALKGPPQLKKDLLPSEDPEIK